MEPPTASAARRAARAADRMRVLLVEDDDGDAMIVEDELEQSGAPVAVRRVRSLAEARDTGLRRLRLRAARPQPAGRLRASTACARCGRPRPTSPSSCSPGSTTSAAASRRSRAGAQDYLVKGATSGAVLHRSLRYAVERRRAELDPAAALDRPARGARERAAGARPAPRPARDATRRCALATHYRPGRRRALLGGDFYDAVQVRDGRVHAVVGDVSGHGPDEAALGVGLRIAWRALVLAGVPAGRVAAAPPGDARPRAPRRGRLHDAVHGHARPRPRGRHRPAGRPPAAAAVRRTSRRARSTAGPPGPPLGVLDAPRGRPAPVRAPGSWSLLLYTDGLIEGARRRRRRRLGDDGPRRAGRRGARRRRRRARRARPARRRARGGAQRRPAGRRRRAPARSPAPAHERGPRGRGPDSSASPSRVVRARRRRPGRSWRPPASSSACSRCSG